jgi:hypothetical protein
MVGALRSNDIYGFGLGRQVGFGDDVSQALEADLLGLAELL